MSVYASLTIVVASVMAICTHYGAEIGQAIFGGSVAVGAAICTISQLVLSLLLAALSHWQDSWLPLVGKTTCA